MITGKINRHEEPNFKYQQTQTYNDVSDFDIYGGHWQLHGTKESDLLSDKEARLLCEIARAKSLGFVVGAKVKGTLYCHPTGPLVGVVVGYALNTVDGFSFSGRCQPVKVEYSTFTVCKEIVDITLIEETHLDS